MIVAVFTMEVVLKLIAFGCRGHWGIPPSRVSAHPAFSIPPPENDFAATTGYFMGIEKLWNWFDMGIVILSLLEVAPRLSALYSDHTLDNKDFHCDTTLDYVYIYIYIHVLAYPANGSMNLTALSHISLNCAPSKTWFCGRWVLLSFVVCGVSLWLARGNLHLPP